MTAFVRASRTTHSSLWPATDRRAPRGPWAAQRLRERVSRHPKAWIRRRLIDRLREAVTLAGGVWIRLASFPYPYRSAFSFRADLDETLPEDYHRFAAARKPLADCCTHFVSTHAYAHHPSVLRDLRDCDTQSHGHFHHVYREPEANRLNLERAHRILRSFGFEPSGFAGPHGRWSPGLDDALEDFGYLYSSDFQLGYDDLPFFPWKGDRFSRILQIPVHPVCEGLFLEAGIADPRVIGEYLGQVIGSRLDAGELAVAYGHPERRLGRMPEVLRILAQVVSNPAAGLAGDVLGPGAVVAMACRAKVAGHPSRGESAGHPVRRVGWRIPVRPGDPSRELPLRVARDGTADVAEPRRTGLPADRRTRADPRPARGRPRVVEPEARGADRDRLGDGDAPRGDPSLVAAEPGQARAEVVEAQASGDRPMRRNQQHIPRTALATTESWLASRNRRECPAGAVFLHAPAVAFQAPGGGENQLVQTARHLESLDVPVRLFSPWIDRLESARLLHLFGMSREGLELARLAQTRGVPVVLSPICWYEPRALAALETHLARKAVGLAAWCLRRLTHRIPSWRRELLHLADAILPNSRAEADQLARLFGVARERLHVVPNGVLPAFGTASPEPFRERWGQDPFVLSVGRIEPRKNTLGLVQAIRRLELPLVVIGEAAPGHRGYAQKCRQAGEGLVAWLGRLDHHDPVLASAYSAARVFALPSWFETPGLAALEAALAGCSVVITPYGSTRDYFGGLVVVRPTRPSRGSQAQSQGMLG